MAVDTVELNARLEVPFEKPTAEPLQPYYGEPLAQVLKQKGYLRLSVPSWFNAVEHPDPDISGAVDPASKSITWIKLKNTTKLALYLFYKDQRTKEVQEEAKEKFK
jgi:hypothetical protein